MGIAFWILRPSPTSGGGDAPGRVGILGVNPSHPQHHHLPPALLACLNYCLPSLSSLLPVISHNLMLCAYIYTLFIIVTVGSIPSYPSSICISSSLFFFSCIGLLCLLWDFVGTGWTGCLHCTHTALPPPPYPATACICCYPTYHTTTTPQAPTTTTTLPLPT